MTPRRPLLVAAGLVALLAAACGDEASESTDADATLPTVVVTTNILGDVVDALAGEQVDVVTIMPVGADPHEFQASAQQADEMREADALIVNGAGFEEGLLDVVDAATADGTPTFEAISVVDTIELGEAVHEADVGGDDEDDHEGTDPHFFTDPIRMAAAVDGITAFLVDEVDGVDAEALRSAAADYVAELETLDADVESTLADVPEERRVLVTNHEVFGYFADRYGFEVVGTVIPGGSTTAGASAGALASLAEVIEDEGVPAIFAETSSSDELADTLAEEVGDVEVVALFSESLGDADSGGDTYLAMVRTNADRIGDALAG